MTVCTSRSCFGVLAAHVLCLAVLGVACYGHAAEGRRFSGGDQRGVSGGRGDDDSQQSRDRGDRGSTPARSAPREPPPVVNRSAPPPAPASRPAPPPSVPREPPVVNRSLTPPGPSVRAASPPPSVQLQPPAINRAKSPPDPTPAQSVTPAPRIAVPDARPKLPEARKRLGGSDDGTAVSNQDSAVKRVTIDSKKSEGTGLNAPARDQSSDKKISPERVRDGGLVAPARDQSLGNVKRGNVGTLPQPTVTLPSSPPSGGAGISDVRKRLGGKASGEQIPLPARGNIDAAAVKQRPPTIPPPGLAGPKVDRPIQPGTRIVPGTTGKYDEAMKARFPERWKAGELNHLTATDTAKTLKLADQYRMLQQGDVARRLELQKHVEHAAGIANLNSARAHVDLGPVHQYHPNFYHGPVSPVYQQYCLKYHYWGPTFFAGACWYPKWNPWVAWSWQYHCHPLWDPRPIWCRPVVYDPCPVWVVWDVPVWTPLPAVSCGTWVDLEPVAVAPAATDLQLLAVRFVDPGHPDEKLGPRYRVWFRNNSSQPVTQPFNVVLLASENEQLAANLPQAGVRVTSIEAGDIQSVDIRLPGEVYARNPAPQDEQPPFSTLHVLVDANQEVADLTRANNGAQLRPAEVLPVDPAAFEMEPVAARAGDELVLAGEGFGPQPGQILVVVDGKEVQGEVAGWYDLGVRLTLPKLAMATPAQADVVVVRGDGAAANPLRINISP